MNDDFVLSNLLPDKLDDRDYIFDEVVSNLPSKFDYFKYVGGIENQLSTGSCVANSAVSSLELLALRNGEEKDFSRLFLYYNLREPYENLKEKDTGAYLRDGFKMINKFGIPDENIWSFDTSKVNIKPDEKSYAEAVQNKVTSYKRILKQNCITDIKSALILGYPIIFSMILDKSFYSLSNDFSTQNYAGTNKKEDVIGSHAMHIIGYDDELNGFYVENSWGSGWGKGGVFLLKYDVLLKDLGDIWCCTGFKEYKMDANQELKQKPVIKYTFFEKVKKFFYTFKESWESFIPYIIIIVAIVLNFIGLLGIG